MSWVRFDDMYPIHRKVEGLTDAAFRLHTEAIFWCARNETDGFVGVDDLCHAAPRNMSNPAAHIPELTRPGRDVWEVSDGGWVIHDYLDYQFSKARLNEDRKKNAVRQQRFRGRASGNRNAVSNAVSNALPDMDRNGVSNALLPDSTDMDRNAVSNGAPSRPDPTRKEDSLRSSPRGDPAFESFYGVYPKHVGRKAAETAWAKALKGGVDAATVIAGAQQYAAERSGQDARYTKAPATWLNQGCWDDEVQPSRGYQGHIAFQNPNPDDYYGDL